MNIGPSKGYLIIDATHGGFKLACEYRKKHQNIFIHDIYNTLKPHQKELLEKRGIEVIPSLDKVKNMNSLKVIYPIHLPLTEREICEKINLPDAEIDFISHHEGIRLIADDVKEILKIEITGVKGKTSSAFILREILNYQTPLMLSSLGIYYKDTLLEKDISITPANILKLIDIARDKSPETMIIESSLGTSSIGDVGLLTNVVENYSIANNLRDAREAKSQVFKNNLIAAKLETLKTCYEEEYAENKHKINSFSVDNDDANLHSKSVHYDLRHTEMKLSYTDIKTINNNSISGEFKVSTFAPSSYHVENILGAVCTALSCEVSERDIINGLERFKGLPGRTNLEENDGGVIISEINPGINTKAIEYSLNMLKNPDEYAVILGGDYGITCEEIDEESVIELLNQRDGLDLTLTGDLGKSIWEKSNKRFEFVEDYNSAVERSSHKNILFIYRSDYRKLNDR